METERCATMGKQLMCCSSSSADRRSRDVRFVGIRSFELIDGLHPVWHILLNDVCCSGLLRYFITAQSAGEPGGAGRQGAVVG